MTLSEWNKEDYIIDFPDLLDYDGPVTDMPLPNKVYDVNKFISDSVVPEIVSCINTNSLLAAVILCLALVDYLAGYLSGQQTTNIEYINFLDEYFPDKYDPFNEFIYVQLRCSLIHNLSAINPWRGENTAFSIHKSYKKPHLVKENNDEGDPFVYFCVPIFLEDIQRACIMYSRELLKEENQALIGNFHSRFDALEGRGSVMVQLGNESGEGPSENG